MSTNEHQPFENEHIIDLSYSQFTIFQPIKQLANELKKPVGYIQPPLVVYFKQLTDQHLFAWSLTKNQI